MNYTVILDRIQNYVRQSFKELTKPDLYYHNLQHTEDVVAAVMQIGNYYQLDDEDFFIVTAAAWLHDTGYLQSPENHEEISKNEARRLLSNWQISQFVVEKIEQCILATRMPQQPHHLLEEIICDADLFHLGSESFSESNERMRKEYNVVHHSDVSKTQWEHRSIAFLQSRQYHTAYSRLLLTAGKEKNIQTLINKVGITDHQVFDKPVSTATGDKRNE